MKIIRSGDEASEAFKVSPAEKRQLLESMAEADRGEFIDGEQLLAELDAAV